LEKQWVLLPGDADMIVMVHRFNYEKAGKSYQLISSLVLEGDDDVYTAMSKTVGMPIAFGAIRLLKGEFKSKGIHIPTTPEFYIPLLDDLKSVGIDFHESISEL
jgi:saccharopine dehydrogenase-like NADP-dependent oxidoreductase